MRWTFLLCSETLLSVFVLWKHRTVMSTCCQWNFPAACVYRAMSCHVVVCHYVDSESDRRMLLLLLMCVRIKKQLARNY